MRWHCGKLPEGWVMLACDVDLGGDDLPEYMAGIRHAVHPFQFDEDPELFWMIISDMTRRAQIVAQPLITSRACAFGGAQ